MRPRYHSAGEAYLKDGKVLQRGTDKEFWVRWVNIMRWISDTEVELAEGLSCGPLCGGSTQAVYEKRDGKWTLKESKGAVVY